MAQLVQVCIIGDPKVGRSQLLLSFAQQTFGTYPRFDNVERDVEIYGQNVRIRVYDPSSHDDYRRTRMALYPNIEAILLCAAMDDPVSLDNLTKKWMEELRSARVSKRPIILLLTKSDLLSEDATPSQRKLIDSKATWGFFSCWPFNWLTSIGQLDTKASPTHLLVLFIWGYTGYVETASSAARATWDAGLKRTRPLASVILTRSSVLDAANHDYRLVPIAC